MNNYQGNILKSFYDVYKSDPTRVLQWCEGSSLDYKKAWEDSSILAAYILGSSFEKEPVAIIGNKEHNFIIGILGCMKAGRPYIPIESDMALERIEKICSVARPGLILNRDKGIRNALALGKELGGLSDNEVWDKCLKLDDLIYLIFTSGSTGMPKGVEITLNCVEDFVQWIQDDFGYGEDLGGGKFLNQLSLSFDFSGYELFNTLGAGGTLYSLTREEQIDFGMLSKRLFLYADEIEIWVSTPSFLRLCFGLSGFKEEMFPNLKHFVLSGETFPMDLARKILPLFPNVKTSNFYGPTEATIVATHYEITNQSLNQFESLPIGVSKPRSEVRIIDNELYLTGPNIARGYHRDKIRTKNSFVTLEDGVYAYKTGDIGYKNDDGLIFFQGRKDHQVKLHGYRIELGEIEHAYGEISFVKDQCIIPLKNEEGIVFDLCIFLILSDEYKKIPMISLRKVLKDELLKKIPLYMIPRKIKIIDHMPLNKNSKLDRGALLEM